MKISRHAFKAARALLDLEQQDVEQATGIHRQRISTFERGNAVLGKKSHDKLQAFFESRGVEFLENDGVRRKNNYFLNLEGTDGFRLFMDNVYHFAKTEGGNISIINGSTEVFTKWLGEEWYAAHAARMETVKDNINFRIITAPQTRKIANSFATYKTLIGKEFSLQTIYLFGKEFGLFYFSDEALKILVINQPEISETLHYMFDLAWSKAQ